MFLSKKIIPRRQKLGLEILILEEFTSKFKILTTHNIYVGNLQLSVKKLQLPAAPVLF